MVEISPAENPRVVQIVELDADRVMPHGLEGENTDMAAARDGLLLTRTVALHFGRGAFDAQELRRIDEAAAIVEVDFEQLLGFLEANFFRPTLGAELLAHRRSAPGASSSLRASSISM